MTLRRGILSTLTCAFFVLASCSGGGGDESSNETSGNPCADLNIKILNGVQCTQASSPVVLVVAIATDRSFAGICTGTLITPTKVLTAAHCISFDAPVNLTVRAGPQAIPVTRAVAHPGYSQAGDGSGLVEVSNYDIAVLTLAQSSAITPVPIVASRAVGNNEQLAVFGYGLDQDNKGVEEYGVDALKATYVRVADTQENLIVTSYDDTKSGACEGDSGGPLTAQVNGQTGIVGVVQGGSNPENPTAAGCGDGFYDIFTGVNASNVLSFITSNAPGVGVL